MNDRETRRYDMFARVRTFGKDRSTDFSPGSKAAGHFANLTRILADLDIAKAGQEGGRATAKNELLEALRIDLQDIARTARAIEATEPGFAAPYRLPDNSSQTALLATADAVVIELAQPGVPERFIAYELPADFVQDLKDDLRAIREADAAMDSDDQDSVASTAAVARLIREGMAEVTQLDAIVRNKYARQAEPLRAWESASHTERAPRREKAAADTPAPTPPAP